MSDSDDRPGGFRRLMDDVGDSPGAVEQLCRDSVSHLAVSGAGVSLVTGTGDRGVICATDAVSARIEELQVSLAEGPCIDAWSDGQAVVEPDMSSATRRRWTAFGPAASEAGAAAVLSVPLHVGATRLGALDVYRDKPGGFSDRDLRNTARLGEAIVQTLLNGHADGRSSGVASVETGLAFGVEFHQAAGMISVQLDVPISEAMARLRAYSFAADRPLRDIAHDVIARRLRLAPDVHGG
jgi:hypothetical protein